MTTLVRRSRRLCPTGMAVVCLAFGCATGGGSQRASVSFAQWVEPVKPFPREIRTVSVVPVGQAMEQPGRATHNIHADLMMIVGPALDERATFDVSGPAADAVAARLQQEIDRQGLSLRMVDRETFQQQLRERDLAMSDLVSPDGVVKLPGMAPVDALLVVKSVANTHLERVPLDTFSIGDINRAIQSEGRYVETTQKMSVQRQITVSTTFRMTVSNTGLVHDAFSSPLSKTDKARPGFISGENMAEANLPPGAEVVQRLLEQQSEQFVGRVVGAETRGAAIRVTPSSNADSKLGARYIESQSWPQALEAFKCALAANPADHQSAFGAGVAAEMMGRSDEAMSFYDTAVRLNGSPTYTEAVRRVRSKVERERRATTAGSTQ